MITVVVVDDQPEVRAGLSLLFGEFDDVDLVGTAAGGAEATTLAERHRPDVMLMDLSMPGVDGVEATSRITTGCPSVAVVVLTTFSDRHRILASLDAGAVGYLMKDTRPDALHDAIRAAATGGSPIDPRIARTLLQARLRPAPDPDAGIGLTAKQAETLRLLAEGLPNRLMARRMGISEKTVKAHLTQIYATLGVEDRVQAALWAQRNLIA